jgi:dihydropteroate synthase
MATLNVTPDSFSDGAMHNTIDTATGYVEEALKKGAEIIDIGGYSTRPGAAFVPLEEEISRVVPVISAIRTNFGHSVLLSIDTFRPEVAEAAVAAGANCINDVYAFSGPNSYPFKPDQESGAHLERMRVVARKAAVPVILMHSRGDAAQNKEYVEVMEGIKAELGDKVNKIIKGKGGVRRWNVVVDPGVGFSKTLNGNLQILRQAGILVSESRRYSIFRVDYSCFDASDSRDRIQESISWVSPAHRCFKEIIPRCRHCIEPERKNNRSQRSGLGHGCSRG